MLLSTECCSEVFLDLINQGLYPRKFCSSSVGELENVSSPVFHCSSSVNEPILFHSRADISDGRAINVELFTELFFFLFLASFQDSKHSKLHTRRITRDGFLPRRHMLLLGSAQQKTRVLLGLTGFFAHDFSIALSAAPS